MSQSEKNPNEDPIYFRSPALLLNGKSAASLITYGSRQLRSLPPAIVELISHCEGGKSLSEHARKSWKSIRWLKRAQYLTDILRFALKELGEIRLGRKGVQWMIRGIFEKLAREGCFISEDELIRSIQAKAPAQPDSCSRLETIGIVTRNRPEQLRASLESYLRELQRLGDRATFVICDDSDSDEIRECNLSSIRELSERYRATIHYAGRRERAELAQALISAGAPERPLRFALALGMPHLHSGGANRNFLSLLTSGKKVLSVDDDTFCRPTAAPDYAQGVKFSSPHEHPYTLKSFKTRQEALASVQPIDKSILELHDRMLGKTLRECVEGDPGAFIRSSGELRSENLYRLVTGKGKVALTFNGLVGDSGCSDDGQFLTKAPKERELFFRSREDYEAYRASREVHKTCSQITLDRPEVCMTTFYGFDNREILPPFFPHFRMEDALFSESMSLLNTDLYSAALPWQLDHLPPARKNEFDRMVEQCMAIPRVLLTQYDVFSSMLKAKGPTRFNRPMEEELKGLGEFCRNFAQLSEWEFREAVFSAHYARIDREINSFEALMENTRRAPSYWKADLKKKIELMKRQLDGQAGIVNIELYSIHGLEEGEQVLKQMIDLFGELMCDWARIRDAYRNLGRSVCITFVDGASQETQQGLRLGVQKTPSELAVLRS